MMRAHTNPARPAPITTTLCRCISLSLTALLFYRTYGQRRVWWSSIGVAKQGRRNKNRLSCDRQGAKYSLFGDAITPRRLSLQRQAGGGRFGECFAVFQGLVGRNGARRYAVVWRHKARCRLGV